MSTVYRAARSALLLGQIDVTNDVLMMQMVGPGYVLNDAHDDIGDVTDKVGAAVTVNITGVVDGEAGCDPVTFVAVPDGSTIAGLVTYVNASGLLVGFTDRRADSVPLNPLAGTGGDLTFNFVDYLLKI